MNFFFWTIKELLPIYHMTETRQTMCTNFCEFHLTYYNEDPQNNFFLDKSQSKFLDISDYFLATPLKMLKYNFLSFHCFPEKFFIDPRDHINICKDFGNLKRFQSKKIRLQTYRHVIWKSFQSYNNWVIK